MTGKPGKIDAARPLHAMTNAGRHTVSVNLPGPRLPLTRPKATPSPHSPQRQSQWRQDGKGHDDAPEHQAGLLGLQVMVDQHQALAQAMAAKLIARSGQPDCRAGDPTGGAAGSQPETRTGAGPPNTPH